MADYLESAKLQMIGMVTDDIVATIARAITEASNIWSRQLLTVAEVFARQLANTSQLREAHQAVGELAQQSVLSSYDQLVTAREGWASRQHYRPGASGPHLLRYSARVLRDALAAPEFFTATAEGINFVNEDFLYKKAAQWHRLNFGAGGAGGGGAGRFSFQWGSLVSDALGYDEPASPPFVLPRGVWIGPEGPVGQGSFAPGSDMFFPAGEASKLGMASHVTRSGPRMTRGIAAKNFLDAGLRRIAQEIPIVYGQLYRQWWDQAKSSAGPLSSVTSVVPSRPYRLRTGLIRG